MANKLHKHNWIGLPETRQQWIDCFFYSNWSSFTMVIRVVRQEKGAGNGLSIIKKRDAAVFDRCSADSSFRVQSNRLFWWRTRLCPCLWTFTEPAGAAFKKLWNVFFILNHWNMCFNTNKIVLYLNHIFVDKILQKIGLWNLHYPAIAKRLFEHEFWSVFFLFFQQPKDNYIINCLIVEHNTTS